MRILFLSLFFLLLNNCSKPKAVLICGDHVCINNAEAEKYFEENLSIEVKIIDKKKKKNLDLVELNLRENHSGNKKIEILPKSETNKNIKILSSKEKKEIKDNLKKRKKNKKISKKAPSQNEKTVKKKKKEKDIKASKKIKNFINKDVNKNRKDIVDVCSLLEKCNISEISKYLIEQGKNKKFPDISKR
tara:strand:- start:439 stop:1005 length:567 start_codon:yes stop_codon:yes gene_type:complete